MKTSHKQIIIAFLWASFLTFIILCAKTIYINWPGPGERGFEEIQTILALREGPTVKIIFAGFLMGLSVLIALRQSKNKKV